MPRPQRLEYENAYYHVMNRGRGRKTIFEDRRYYETFQETLAEAHERFGLVIHAYCLMGNHYHLLLQTPNANLSRTMRHINGVYTQRYNRIKKTDGPQFRGRYKAILVEADSYLLPLSRYIHRNPIETKRKLVTDLSNYPWSSYQAYVQPNKQPAWLTTEKIHGVLGKKQKYVGYKTYVEAGIDEDIKRFYNKGNMAQVLGGKAFKEDILEKKESLKKTGKLVIFEPMKSEKIIAIVAKVYKTTALDILKPQHEGRKANVARKVAMYSCQYYGDYRLKEIAECFGLTHPGSVSRAIHDIRKLIKSGNIKRQMKQLDKLMVKKRT